MKVKPHSALRFSDYLVVDGIEYWGLPHRIDLSERAGDVYHTVLSYDRLDLLADRYYGDPVLKWVIMEANGIELDRVRLEEGSVLRIPYPRFVLNTLFRDQARF